MFGSYIKWRYPVQSVFLPVFRSGGGGGREKKKRKERGKKTKTKTICMP
jgi:hypothetical protein